MPEVNVIVQNADGSPLMPTHHYGRVKRMLKAGKARIVSVKPFVIRLTYTIINPGLDTITLGIDPGRTNIGLSLIDSKGRNLGSYLVETDNHDIPHNMNNKKKHRRASRRGERKRRQRRAVVHDNTLKITELYRILPGCKKAIKCKGIKNSESRFNNRKRPEGWLTPTAKHSLNTHLRIVEIMSRYYPIANAAIEINRFDFAKMENPGIRNWEYQKGRLFGFKDRNDAVFHDQNGKCLLCGRRPIEHYHHIMPRRRGSESIDNIAGFMYTLSRPCTYQQQHACKAAVQETRHAEKVSRTQRNQSDHAPPVKGTCIQIPYLYNNRMADTANACLLWVSEKRAG